MARRASFEQFRGDLTEEDLNNMVRVAKKRRMIYLIGWLISFALVIAVTEISIAIFKQEIPFIGFVTIPLLGIFAGLAAYTHNVICYVKTRGRRQGGNGLLIFIGTVAFGVVIGFIITIILNNIFPISVLGWKKLGITRRW